MMVECKKGEFMAVKGVDGATLYKPLDAFEKGASALIHRKDYEIPCPCVACKTD